MPFLCTSTYRTGEKEVQWVEVKVNDAVEELEHLKK